VLFRGDERPWNEPLQKAAAIGRGDYLFYNKDSKETLDSLFEHMFMWKNQYVINYKIPELKNGTHEVSIVNTSNTIKISKSYRLNIKFLPPKIQIISPINGTVFNQSGAEPILVDSKISFPDGVEREIKSVSLIVNGNMVQSVENPIDLTVSIPWDTSINKLSEETAMTLTIEAVDTLGMIGTSDPVIVTIKPIGIGGLPTTSSPTFLSYILQYGGFLLGLVAVILVFLF